jgi:predicted membrane protein
MSSGLDNGWTRAVSLFAALTLMLLVTLLPRGLTVADGSPIGHGVLMLIMWGLSAGFVYGVGFIPSNGLLRVLLGPIAAWCGMGVGFFFYIQHFMR